MLDWKPTLAVFGVMFFCAAPQCQSDDDSRSGPNTFGGIGGAIGTGGADSSGGSGFLKGTGGMNPWIDAGPLCVKNLPSNIARVQTYAAADVENCVLVLEDSTIFQSLYDVYVFVDCNPISKDSDDGGQNWSYDHESRTFRFSVEICGSLESHPNQRVDVTFAYVYLE